jgi:hypothetical protein
MQVLALDGLEAYSMASFTRALGWSLAETQVLPLGARKDYGEFLSDRTFSANVLN